MMFYDWSECVMSVYLAPQNVPHAIVLTLGNKVVLYCSVCDVQWHIKHWEPRRLS